MDDTGASAKADQALAVPATPLRVDGPPGFDPSRKLRAMSHEQLVAECCYRGAELVIARQRNALAAKQFAKSLLLAWTDFLDANPDDVNSPEEYPDHALVTFDQVLGMVLNAIAMEARQRTDPEEGLDPKGDSAGLNEASPNPSRQDTSPSSKDET